MNLAPERWIRRDSPLVPCAALATGPAAHMLAQILIARDPFTTMRGLAGKDLLLIVAEQTQLPWVDGIHYLGRDPLAERLLLPTTHRPPVHPALLQTALRVPTAVNLSPALLVTLTELRLIHGPRLVEWLA